MILQGFHTGPAKVPEELRGPFELSGQGSVFCQQKRPCHGVSQNSGGDSVSQLDHFGCIVGRSQSHGWPRAFAPRCRVACARTTGINSGQSPAVTCVRDLVLSEGRTVC